MIHAYPVILVLSARHLIKNAINRITGTFNLRRREAKAMLRASRPQNQVARNS